jgi:hypothetical protein
VPPFPVSRPGLPSVQEIDGTIEFHVQHIYYLRKLRNMHTAPNRLPDETLAQVFWHCLPVNAGWTRGRPHDHDWRERDGYDVQRFLRVIQTCHRWYSIAMGCSRLWTLLPCHKASWTDTMLQRAQHSALTLVTSHPMWSLGGESSSDHVLHDLVLTHLPRVRSLRTWIERALWAQYFEAFMTRAPALESDARI